MMRRVLQASPYVRNVSDALYTGGITAEALREFASSVVGGFSVGRRLSNDLALAALAVVLEHRQSKLADEFLHDLAGLQLAEMSMSIRVARECLKHRCASPRNLFRTFDYGAEIVPDVTHWVAKSDGAGNRFLLPASAYSAYSEAKSC